jgi:hypothetical protein
VRPGFPLNPGNPVQDRPLEILFRDGADSLGKPQLHGERQVQGQDCNLLQELGERRQGFPELAIVASARPIRGCRSGWRTGTATQFRNCRVRRSPRSGRQLDCFSRHEGLPEVPRSRRLASSSPITCRVSGSKFSVLPRQQEAFQSMKLS